MVGGKNQISNDKIQAPNKFEIPNIKPATSYIEVSMNQSSQPPRFDLEERTYLFARDVALFVKEFPRSASNVEYIKQLIRSSGSVGANYIEANESLGKKDFLMKIKTSRKEAKESVYWLRLLKDTNEEKLQPSTETLIQEATELKKIFSTILKNSE